MEIKRICALYYSATGNTSHAVETVAQALAERFSVPLLTYSFTRPQERETVISFAETDLVVVGSPTYAGKLPNKLLPDFQTKLAGNGAMAVAVVTFGGRSYDNALAELCAVLESDGFCTVAGGAFVGQHSFCEDLQQGRPDAADCEELHVFAEKIAGKVRDLKNNKTFAVPGDAAAPYYTPLGQDGQPAKFLKAKPCTDLSKCDRCRLCVELCPVGSINKEDPAAVPGPCIKCYACIRNCPKQAKFFDDPAFLSHVAMLQANCRSRKKNEWYL